ncbi:hypothetical protein [Halapricum hydrolyticum]|uniref:Uncharacterized protein n=1 Tax=Halapricum hydrolyticum TaxID=2979991 RepID=A0AAE3IAV5_9EURY|nr:hypothetical protein [Halapricum hydrolyticum]MCU4717725.1 hypothetical protein [Halapricum hydrolyticum]MCU4726746.1 hypothetical protein [Halapricum hydrolyticum]
MFVDSQLVDGFESLLRGDSYHHVYLTYFAASNDLVSFRNAFFEDVGLTGSQMGLLVAGGLVAQPVWGVLADRFSCSPVRAWPCSQQCT